jgi:hypothetical protein
LIGTRCDGTKMGGHDKTKIFLGNEIAVSVRCYTAMDCDAIAVHCAR